MIKIYNDKKEKSQSFEASIDVRIPYNGEPIGYGSNDDEAMRELLKEVRELTDFYKKVEVKLLRTLLIGNEDK
jgi:hypothetical protein